MRAGFYRVSLYCFCFCVVVTACLILASNARAERLPLKVYTSADGLGSSFVDTLTRDSRGFMWFATRDGLSRFDGSRFITYQVGKENAAPGVANIYETRKGVYWVATTGGLYRFRPDALVIPSAKGERAILNAEFVSTQGGILFEDSRENLWLLSGGLQRIVEKDGGQAEFQKIALNLPETADPNFIITDIRESSDGSLWLKTSHGVIRRLPDNREVLYPYDVGVLLSNVDLMIDREDRVWLTMVGKLLVIKPETISELGEFEKTKKLSLENAKRARLDAEIMELPDASGEIIAYEDEGFLANHQIKYLLQTSDGHVWMTTREQLIEFDGRKARLYPKIAGTSNMKRMAEDVAGNLWISGTQNLLRLNRRGIMTFDDGDGLKSSDVQSIGEDSEGRIYTANGANFLTEFANGKITTVTLKTAAGSIPMWTARPALRDRSGNLWLTSSGGLYKFPATADFAELEFANPVIYGAEKGLKAKGTYQIYEDSRGTIWVSTLTNIVSEQVLARYDSAADKFITFTKSEGFPEGKSASAFAEDARGDLWIAFYQGGIMRFRDGRFEEISGIEGISTALVSDLLFDKNGRLWIASAISGVLRIDNPNGENFQIIRYSIENGLSSNNIRTLVADREGNIYAGTVRGVDRIAPETGSVKHFSIDDGLASDFVVDSLCDRDGNIWFATMNGVSRLKLSENKNQNAPKVWIGALNVAGVPQAVGELGSERLENLEFPYTDNNFQIEFFALDFTPDETLRYQYKFEGTGADWSRPTENRTVNFANLAPGEYRFLVRTVNASGAASENPATIVFRINQPFWRTWWFLLLATLFVASVLYSLYLYRTKNLRRINKTLLEIQIAEEKLLREREKRLAELERVRTRIATDLHDDIGSSLTQIAVLSEVARNQAAALRSETVSMPLERIKGVSRELVETMSDVVWAINPNKDNLRDLVQRMRRFASDVCAGKNIHFELDAPPTENLQPLGANVRREVFAIFKESINNAVKYSECKNIAADFRIENDALFLEIEDDGCGFAAAEVLSEDFSPEIGGNGLVNMRRRASELGGNCRIISETGGGTKIFLEVPLNLSEEEKIAPAQSGGENSNGNHL